MAEPEEGKAILFMSHPSLHAGPSEDVFLESESETDPFTRAEGLWESVKGDFPGAIHAIGLNDRGRALMATARMHAMGFESYTVEDALRG